MLTIQSASPSASLSEFVADYVLRTERLGHQVLARPVTARPDVILLFHLGEPIEAFEYSTGRTRLLPGAMLVGPQTGRKAELLESGSHARFITRFQPGGLYRLFHSPIAALVDTALDARHLLGPGIERLHVHVSAARTLPERVRLIEAFLGSRLAVARPRHPAVDAARVLMDSHGTRRVSDLIGESGLSARQFERAFREHMGISPKLFARAARLD